MSKQNARRRGRFASVACWRPSLPVRRSHSGPRRAVRVACPSIKAAKQFTCALPWLTLDGCSDPGATPWRSRGSPGAVTVRGWTPVSRTAATHAGHGTVQIMRRPGRSAAQWRQVHARVRTAGQRCCSAHATRRGKVRGASDASSRNCCGWCYCLALPQQHQPKSRASQPCVTQQYHSCTQKQRCRLLE